MYNYSKIIDDCICIVHQCNSGNLSWVKLTLLFLQCTIATLALFIIANLMHLVIWCMCEGDLYWSGEVGCATSITLETGRDNWRGQTKHITL